MEALIIPSFIAGLLTFLAPCTLPLVPAYLSFIGGTSATDAATLDARAIRKRVIINGVFFVLGFSIIFITLGVFAGALGSVIGEGRVWVTRIGGGLIVLFGLMMLNVIKFDFLSYERKPSWVNTVSPGSYGKSLLIGIIFGSGWTPCIGPVLGSVLVLAGTSATAGSGAFLLAVFSAGLAVPFMAVALAIGKANEKIARYAKYLKAIQIIGGVFLIGLGALLVFDKMPLIVSYGYKLFDFINYEDLQNYL